MNLFEAMQTGKFFTRPSWAAGLRVKFTDDGFVSMRAGDTATTTAINLVPEDYNAKDFVLFENKKAVTGAQLKEVLDKVIMAAPRSPTRTQLKGHIIKGVMADLGFVTEE